MNKHYKEILLSGFFISITQLLACTTSINFDQLPDGVTANTGVINENDFVDPNSIVADQFANKGITFSSSGSGVFLLAGTSTPSQPNVACPTQANDRAGFSEPVEILINRSKIRSACDAWITLTGTSGRVMVTSFDSGGAQVDSVTTHQDTAGAPIRVHLDGCGTKRITIVPTIYTQPYCLDDFKIRTYF